MDFVYEDIVDLNKKFEGPTAIDIQFRQFIIKFVCDSINVNCSVEESTNEKGVLEFSGI